MIYSETDIGELRKMANGTTMPAVSQGDRIRLRPVGTTWIPEEPGMAGNPDTTPDRASEQEACTRGAGSLSYRFSSFSRKLRAHRGSAPWVNIEDLS